MPNTPGYQLGYKKCTKTYSDSYNEYNPNPQVPEGTWNGDVSMHDPTHLISTDDGTLLVFGSGQGVCGQNLGIGYKYMIKGTNTWVQGPQMYGGCGAEQQPDWIPGEVGAPLQDFDAPEVLYSETAVFPTPNYETSGDAGDLRKWVMYYSVYLNTPDVEDPDEEIGQGCIGRATATGPPDNLVWTEDGKPVYCSNINYDSNQYPITKRYDSEIDYIENVGAMDFAIDPALVKDSQTGNYIMSWGSGAIHAVPIDPLTGHVVESAMSSNCNGPCKDGPDDEDSNFDIYTVLSLGGENFNEAPFILEGQRNNNNNINYHYLFVNWWGCCAGKCSTYEIRVGRSTKGVLGPYKDKNGLRMDREEQQTVWGSENHSGGSVFLKGEGRYIGPGHGDVFRYMKEGATSERLVFTFHWYDNLEDGTAKIGARELTFDAKDWPVLSSTPWDVCDFTGCTDEVCANDRTYFFKKAKKTCEWIGRKEARRGKLCKKKSVLAACPMTCGVCCLDDATFTFKFKGAKDCAWLSRQKEKRIKNICRKKKEVRSNCPITCEACLDRPATIFG